jgi:hypothetical protein
MEYHITLLYACYCSKVSSPYLGHTLPWAAVSRRDPLLDVAHAAGPGFRAEREVVYLSSIIRKGASTTGSWGDVLFPSAEGPLVKSTAT